MEYEKIETLYVRDEKTHKVLPDQIRLPEFTLPRHWIVTEKIDGMNVRLRLGWNAEVEASSLFRGGRTDKADMPKPLLAMLTERFPLDLVKAAFEPGTEAIIYGEGYGPGIQKGGGNYTPRVSFRVFDVLVFDPRWRPGEVKAWWLDWEDVVDVAHKIGAETVPLIGYRCDLQAALGCLQFKSTVAACENAGKDIPAEGIVARTDPLLFMRNGKRLMWKLKGKDF